MRRIWLGAKGAWMLNARDRKYPNADHELTWQFVFASTRISRCPAPGGAGGITFTSRPSSAVP